MGNEGQVEVVSSNGMGQISGLTMRILEKSSFSKSGGSISHSVKVVVLSPFSQSGGSISHSVKVVVLSHRPVGVHYFSNTAAN